MGPINFDDFRFHESRPSFSNEIVPSELSTLPPMEVLPHAGLSGVEAARAMTVPKGFSVTLAASEPDVEKPIAFTLDDRGRLWVAEAHTYPVRAADGQGKDRILILEDTDATGLVAGTVFSRLKLISGIEAIRRVGRRRPHMVLPSRRDGSSCRPPQVMLDVGYRTRRDVSTVCVGPTGGSPGSTAFH